MASLKTTLNLRRLFEVIYNSFVTHVPSHHLRLAYLRFLGMKIGRHSTVLRGTQVHWARLITMGSRSVVSWRVVLDGRGGIDIGDDVVIASDVQLITAEHLISSPTFEARFAPITINRYAWLGTRCMVFLGVTIGEGGVVAGGGVAVRDVPDYVVVGGVPAKPIAERNRDLDYNPYHRPLWY